MERLDKLVAAYSEYSRKDVRRLVKEKRIEVNGAPASSFDQKIKDEDCVLMDGEPIVRKRRIVAVLNKPMGFVTSTEDPRDRTVMELVPRDWMKMGVFPVGRLDKDTEGLLVLTNDGQLAHRVLSPKKHVPKTYYAKIEGRVTEEDIKAFEAGVTLDDGYETMPAQLKIIESGEQSEIELTIHEGKFHQVKRMCESVGKKVVYLKRLSMGKLMLDENLGLGEYRELTDEEVKLIEER